MHELRCTATDRLVVATRSISIEEDVDVAEVHTHGNRVCAHNLPLATAQAFVHGTTDATADVNGGLKKQSYVMA